tara:strand:- start:1738 stop:2079 length:342 start_codon:yes stop_codon:yes gene_type:complete
MVYRPQKTKFQIFVVDIFRTIKLWAVNPWRRLSLIILIFFIGYLIGSSLGMISAVYNLMDPIGAIISVLFIEILIKLRRVFNKDVKTRFYILLTDCLRIGICYGFFTEGLKLL